MKPLGVMSPNLCKTAIINARGASPPGKFTLFKRGKSIRGRDVFPNGHSGLKPHSPGGPGKITTGVAAAFHEICIIGE